MATQILVQWTPPADALTQSVDYRRKIDVAWTEAVTGLGGAVNQYTIIPGGGVEDNRIYQTRARSVCANGGSEFISAVREAIAFTCPVVTVNATNTTLEILFDHLGGDVDKYIVKLYDSTGTNVVASSVINSGLAGTLSTTFSALTKNTAYKVLVEVYAAQYSKLNCAMKDTTTTNQNLCGAPVVTGATIS